MASDTGSFSFSPASVLETRIEDLVGQRQRPVLPPGRALFSPIIKSLAGQILSIFLPLIPSLSHLWLTLMIKNKGMCATAGEIILYFISDLMISADTLR